MAGKTLQSGILDGRVSTTDLVLMCSWFSLVLGGSLGCRMGSWPLVMF